MIRGGRKEKTDVNKRRFLEVPEGTMEKSRVSYSHLHLFTFGALCSWHYTQTRDTNINNIQCLPSRSMQSCCQDQQIKGKNM